MTTNNPPIAAWAPSTALAKLESRHNNAPCILTDTPAEFNDVALVRLSDYKALQAECEKLRMQLQSMVDQTTPLEPVPGDPKWSRRIQLDAVIEERDALRVECEKLRAEYEEELFCVRQDRDAHFGELMRAIEQVDAMKAECEKLRKDAERYRWLREQCGSSGLLTIAKVGAFELNAWSGDDPDAAIDAAMQGDQP